MTHTTAPNIQNAPLGLLIALAAAISISFSNILAPAVVASGSNTATLLIFRFVSFLLVCGLWMKLNNSSFVLERPDRIHCVGAGLANTAGSGALIASFIYLPISLAILFFYTFPLLTRLGECLLNRRRPAPVEILCLLGALIGLVICLGFGFDRLNGPGLVFAALAALSIASSFLWAGHKLKSVQPTLQTFYMAVTGLIVTVAFTLTTGSWAPPPPEVIAIAVMAGAALTYAAAFFAIYKGIGMIGASRTAMVMNLEPVLTVGLAILLLQEDLSPHQFFGAALVIAAVFVSQLRPAIETPQQV